MQLFAKCLWMMVCLRSCFSQYDDAAKPAVSAANLKKNCVESPTERCHVASVIDLDEEESHEVQEMHMQLLQRKQRSEQPPPPDETDIYYYSEPIVGSMPGMVDIDSDEDACRANIARMFQLDYSLRFFDMTDVKDAQEITYTSKDVDEALKIFQDSKTGNIEIEVKQGTSCHRSGKSVVWLYPTKRADHNDAFQISEMECKRMFFTDLDRSVECIQVYRLPSAAVAEEVLDHYHDDDSILHAVLGGHGDDSRKNDGGLLWSKDDPETDEVEEDANLRMGDPATVSMLEMLKQKIYTRGGTIFLDSCFGGINGLAEQVSLAIPKVWVFGGVVSLNANITLHSTPWGDGSNVGPPRAVSEINIDQVKDSMSVVDDDYAVVEASWGGIEDSDGKKTYFQGERLIVWRDGEFKGSVTQYLYPTANDMVLQVGASVTTTEKIPATRFEGTGEKSGLAVFRNYLPSGLKGTVQYIYNTGRLPVSGNALIQWELPSSWQYTDGGGATLGDWVVEPGYFHTLVQTSTKEY